MNVVGLDLSLTATGYAATASTWVYPGGRERGTQRLILIRDWILNREQTHDADVVALEDLPIGARNNAAGPLGMLHGVIRVALHEAGIPVVLIPPANVKKYATGRGNAPKPDMRMELFKRTQLDLADDNAVDAFWLRAMTMDYLGEPVATMPAAHRAALAKIDWPDLNNQPAGQGVLT